MGAHPSISADAYPEQGRYLNVRTRVCFHYDTSRTFEGRIIRDDAEDPGVLVIQLDDGRVVLASECMYSPQPGVSA